MIELRLHGRGGQGAVTASKILAGAFVEEGRCAQALAYYGGERRGAPVLAMVRVDDRPIRQRTLIYEPDAAIVFDATLFAVAKVAQGLRPGGLLLVNTPLPREAFAEFGAFHVVPIDAARIARRIGLGTASNPIVNTAMCGAYAGAAGRVGAESLLVALRTVAEARFDANAEAIRRAYDLAAEIAFNGLRAPRAQGAAA